ncbi:hypothetical protein GGH96_006322, partial [Coemansia sp. RSA 1972]
MPVYSVAQLLPAHIISSIIHHVPIAHSKASPITVALEPPLKSRWLAALLGVCQSWRPAACSAFYAKVLIKLDSGSGGRYDGTSIVRAHDAGQNGCQRYVKDVLVLVEMSNFNRVWDSHTPNLASIVRDCQQLPYVRAIAYYLVLYDIGRVMPEPDQSCNAMVIGKNVDVFATAIRETMPRFSQAAVYSQLIYALSPPMQQITENVIGLLSKLIGSQPTRLSLAHVEITDNLASISATASLQGIALSTFQGQELEAALVQRNASTLERIWIETTTPLALVALVRSPSQALEVCTYPRLLHFVAQWSHGQRDPDGWQPPVSPFPRLKTLKCRGYFPYTQPAILAECQNTLCHLDIELDAAFLAALDQANVLAKGAFPKLSYLSLSWLNHAHARPYNRNSLFYKSLDLCQNTHTLCLRWMKLANINQLVAKVQFPQMLRNLDIPYTMLNIDQAIAILCACPQVLKANLSLADIGAGSGKGMPAPGLLVKYQNKYSGCAARTKYLGLQSWSCRSTRRAAELCVLLVDVIPSIVRVCISPEWHASQHGFLKDVDMARKRS